MGAEPAPQRRLTGRVGDNLAALELLKQLQAQGRPATEQERHVLARWRSWGAVPQVFEETSDRASRLRGLLNDVDWAAARRTTINAHYTDPAIAAAIWSVVLDLHGLPRRVLEPGCGSGVFFGTAPEGISLLVGVELDPTSAAITRALYPQARFQVRVESFAESRLPPDAMDVTIGNVPFAKIALHDPQHNRGRHTMHNHFIIKSLAVTRPGGMVAVLTSRYTLDALDRSAREEMHARADLLAAVRLPSGAHRAYAGTEAVTDLVVFRVRSPGQPAAAPDWLESRVDPHLQVPISSYWHAHPDAVLGQMRIDAHGLNGRTALSVIDDPVRRVSLPDRLRAAAVNLARCAPEPSPVPDRLPPPAPPLELTPPPAAGAQSVPGGRIVTLSDGGFAQYKEGLPQPLTVPARCASELRLLIRLREQVLTVLDLEASTREDTPQLRDARAGLAATYDDYLRRHGPINRVTVLETSRLDKAGKPVMTRRFPAAARVFRGDPHSPTVRALELYDEATQAAAPAAILSRRVLTPRQARNRADTPADALAICLDTHGRVELDRIAALLASPDRAHARARLGTLVFDDPVSGQLIPAPQYLSGNVRKALAAAQQALQDDPRYTANVEALTAVLPADLTPEEITANLGAVWVPASDIREFLRDVLNDRAVRVEHLGGAAWKVRDGQTHSPAATVTWGTSRMSAHEIVERLMSQKRIVVYDTVVNSNGNDIAVVNPVETEAAAAKADGLQARFREWVWSDPGRAQRLARSYNDTFNAIVLRSYDAEGDRLSLPGLASDFTPHRHQLAAVARMIGEPAVGLFHAVGAGKTAEMVMGATELRRLGLVTKPAVVVPNHMLEQFTREWLQLYPAANVLTAASEDLRAEARRSFIARAATGTWDAVILTQGAFASIPVSAKGQRDYLDREVQVLRDQLERARGADVSRMTLKQMESAVCRLEEKVKARVAHKTDPGLVWEQLGVDYLIIDELHLYKNLTITSNIHDVARDGSIRATDLDMKISLLRAQAGPGGHVLTGATATPIANTMAEAWVMQRYLRPDLLTDAGLTDFDSWAATFGKTVTKIEMRPAGDGFRAVDRFASFQNLPELLAMWHVPADVKTSADLGLPVPDLSLIHI